MKGSHWMQVFCSKIFPCERSSPLSVSARPGRKRAKEKKLPKKKLQNMRRRLTRKKEGSQSLKIAKGYMRIFTSYLTLHSRPATLAQVFAHDRNVPA
jgi:hypothetical protein